MRKRFLSLFLVLALLANTAIFASAATPRAVTMTPGIEFNGETATCTVDVCADYTTDKIFAIVKLFDEDNNCVKTWVQSGTGYLSFTRTAEVTSGVKYTLKAYVTVNDVSKPTVSATGTCP